MTKENKNKATLLTLLCVWPGFLLLTNAEYSGWLLTTTYIFWLAVTIFIGKIVLQGKPIKLADGSITPIYDATLKELGFRYNVQHERWQIGCIGAPCFIFYNPTSSSSIPNMIECNNQIDDIFANGSVTNEYLNAKSTSFAAVEQFFFSYYELLKFIQYCPIVRTPETLEGKKFIYKK